MYNIISMNIKELIEKAVENLNRVRQLNLSIINILSQLDPDNFLVSILDNGSSYTFDTTIDKNISTQQLLPDDLTNISPDNIIMLRIAKQIFEAYKKFKTTLVNSSIILSNSSLTSSQPISTLDIGGTTYDISIDGRSLTDTIDVVDELKNKVRDLENINSTLICEINDLKALLKAKGIL